MTWSGYSEQGQGSQERGPSTFAFQPGTSPRAQGTSSVSVNAGYQRGQDIGSALTYREGDSTLAQVVAFASTTLAPAMAEARDARFLEGMTRAASGEELTKIVNEQPWYSKIFGVSSAAQGARAYSLQANAAAVTTAIENQMPVLRTMSPDAVPKAIMDMTKEYMTGDDETDTLLQMNILKTFPSVIKMHTREHYKYQQEEASKARFGAMQAASTSLNVAASSDMSTPEDLDVRLGVLLDVLTPPPGVDLKSWENDTKNFIVSAAESGQFHTLTAMQASGIVNAMQPETRLQVERQIQQYQRQHAREAADGYSEKFLEIRYKAQTGQYNNGEEVFKAYDAINEDYTKRTGNPYPLAGKTEKVSSAMSAAQALLYRDRELAKQAGSAQDAEARQALLDQLVVTSGTKAAKLARFGTGPNASFKDYEIEGAFMQRYRQLDEKGQIGMLMRDAVAGGKVDMVAVDYERLANSLSDSMNDNFVQLYGKWKAAQEAHPLTTDIPNPVHSTYFAPKVHAMLSRFDTALAGRPIGEFGEAAFSSARNIINDPGYQWGKKEKPDVQGFIDKHVRGNALWASEAAQFAGNEPGYIQTPPKLYGTSERVIMNMMAEPYGTLKQGVGDPDLAMRDAFKRAEANGLEVYGQHAWVVGKGRDSLEAKLSHRDAAPITKVEIAAGLNAVINERLKAITSDSPDDVHIIRTQDTPSGDPQFVAYAQVKGQVLSPTFLNGTDIVSAVRENRSRPARDALAKEREVQAIKTPTGTGILTTPLPPLQQN